MYRHCYLSLCKQTPPNVTAYNNYILLPSLMVLRANWAELGSPHLRLSARTSAYGLSLWLLLPPRMGLVPRVSIPRDPSGSCIDFYDIASNVSEHQFCHSQRPAQVQGEGIQTSLLDEGSGTSHCTRGMWDGRSCCDHLGNYIFHQNLLSDHILPLSHIQNIFTPSPKTT